MKARIVYNGREYASPEAMPDEVRREFEAVMAHLADSDQNGIPDVIEQGDPDGTQSRIAIGHSSITFDGRTFASTGAMPPFLRRLFEQSLASAHRDRGDASQTSGHTAADARGAGRGAADAALLGAMGGAPFGRTDRRDDVVASLDRVSHGLSLFLGAFLGVAALAVLACAVAVIVTMEESSRSQGGRIYVAAAALVVLGALDAQAARMVTRRWGSAGLFGTSPESRRFAIFSMVFLVLAAGLLFGLALLLP